MIEKINVLLLGGGKTKTSMRRFSGEESKALIKIGPENKPMILHVIESFQKAKYINKIIVAGPPKVRQLLEKKSSLTVSEGQTIYETVKIGLSYLKEDSIVMISTCDIPLVSERHIENFIEKCQKTPGFDIYYPIVSKKDYLEFYPSLDLRRTYANFVNGSFTGGNILLINPKIIYKYGDLIKDFIHFRKHPLKMARLLGTQIASKYLRKYLTIQDLEKRVSILLGGYKGKAILSSPEISLDIDKPRHLKAFWSNYQ